MSNSSEISEKIKILVSMIKSEFDYNEWLNRFNRLLILITVKNENLKKFDLLVLLEEGFRNFQNIIAENNKFKKLFKIILLKSIDIIDNDELIIITRILNGLINCTIKGNSIYQISFERVLIENENELSKNDIDLYYLSFLFKYFLFFYFNIHFDINDNDEQNYFKEIIYSRIENIFQLNMKNVKQIFIKYFYKLFQKTDIYLYTNNKIINYLFVDILSNYNKNNFFKKIFQEIILQKLKNEKSNFNIVYNTLLIDEKMKYYKTFIKQVNENEIDIKNIIRNLFKPNMTFDMTLIDNKKQFIDFLSIEIMNNFKNFELFPKDFFIISNKEKNIFSDFSFYNIEFREFYRLKNYYEEELLQYINSSYLIKKFLNSPYNIIQKYICGNNNIGNELDDNLNFYESFLILLLLYQIYKSSNNYNDEIKSLIKVYFNKCFEFTCKEQELFVCFFNFILLIDNELYEVCFYSLEANRKFFELSNINNNKYMKIIFSYYIFSINYFSKLNLPQETFVKEIDLIIKYIKIMNKFCENYNLSKLQYLNIQLVCILIKLLIKNDNYNNNIEHYFEYCFFCYKKLNYEFNKFELRKISKYVFECPKCKKYNIFLNINKTYINSLNQEIKEKIINILINGTFDNFEVILNRNLGEFKNLKDERYLFIKVIEIEIKSIFKLIKYSNINFIENNEKQYPNYYELVKNPLLYDEKYINPIFDISFKSYLSVLKNPNKIKEYIDKIKLLYWIVYSKRKY